MSGRIGVTASHSLECPTYMVPLSTASQHPRCGQKHQAGTRLSACRLAGFAAVGRDRLSQRRPPRRSLELVTEILGFVCDVALGELHNAHRERRDAVVGDDALADPQIPDAADPADREMPVCRVTAALC